MSVLTIFSLVIVNNYSADVDATFIESTHVFLPRT